MFVVSVGQLATQLRAPESKNVPEGHLQFVPLKIAPAATHSNCFVQGLSLRSPAEHSGPNKAFCVVSIPGGHDATQPTLAKKILPAGHLVVVADVAGLVTVANPSCVRFRILHAR
jgi:hypothetical protein